MARGKYPPKLWMVGDDVIITLDGDGPRNGDDKPVARNHGWKADRLRFSVTRGGKFKLAKTVKVTPNLRTEPMRDQKGERVPNPNFEKPIEGDPFGRRDYQRWMTEVIEDEPEATAAYEVDGTWWKRHGVTLVSL